MIARLRTLWRRAFHRGYSRGYGAGMADAAHSLPPELIEAYQRYTEASYPSTQRDELKEDFLELFDDLLTGELEYE